MKKQKKAEKQQQEELNKKVEKFKKKYIELTDKEGLMILPQLQVTKNGVIPVLEIVEKPKPEKIIKPQ